MSRSLSLRFALLMLMAITAPAMAQTGAGPSGMVLSSTEQGVRGETGPRRLVPGVPARSGATGWTEVAMSDGTSIVLEAGARLTARTTNGLASQTAMDADIDGGRIRVSIGGQFEMRLHMPDVEISNCVR